MGLPITNRNEDKELLVYLKDKTIKITQLTNERRVSLINSTRRLISGEARISLVTLSN